jgi:tetraacyldisaccharide 4'-kinase
MREPYFWSVTDRRSRASAPMTKLLLSPLAMAYRIAGERRVRSTTPEDVGLPVVCIGNLTLGGAGKTPITEAVRAHYDGRGLRAASLSRGYRGSLKGVHRVDPAHNTFREVGDEPLMLSASGETWVSKDRPAGALAMKADGVQVIVMDDGHQNPTLNKSLSIVVVDAGNAFGNGHVFPKGPLREPVATGLSRADAVVLMGDGGTPNAFAGFRGPILRARLAATSSLPPGRYVAFAGIGRPSRFFDSLGKQRGVEVAEGAPYPDHHAFTPYDLAFLMKLAADHDARLVTTDKDYVRLPADMKDKVARASVKAAFEDEEALARLLDGVVR